MRLSRTAIAVSAIVLAPTYLLLAEPAPPKPIGILFAAGDISYCTEVGADQTAALIRNEIKAARDRDPAVPIRVLALGDLAYETGTPEQLECFRAHWKDFYDILLPVPGNHEYEETNRYGTPYFEHFKKYGLAVKQGEKTVPLVVQNGEATGYYAVNFPGDAGPWRLIGLNAYAGGTKRGKNEAEKKIEREKKRQARKIQTEWLDQQLDPQKNKQNCVLAFWHPPIFSSGKHGHDDKKNIGAPLVRDDTMLWALQRLYARGGSVILAGHEHSFEQFSPHDDDGKAKKGGIRTFVVGTGGAELTKDDYNNKVKSSEGIFGKPNGSRGVLRLELYDTKYESQFVPVIQKLAQQFKKTETPCNARK